MSSMDNNRPISNTPAPRVPVEKPVPEQTPSSSSGLDARIRAYQQRQQTEAIKQEAAKALYSQQEATPLSDRKEEVEQAVTRINDYVQNMRRTLNFKMSEEESGRVIIEVYDSETKELIRRIPPDDALEMSENLNQGLDGFLVNIKA